MVARTGTASQVDASAGSGSTSVTVPADCNLVVATWGAWSDTDNATMASLSINGVGFSIVEQLGEGTGDESGVGVAILENPSTGSQTLAWAWSNSGTSRIEGGELVLTYVKDANAGDAVRDTATDHDTVGTPVSVTVTSVTSDLVLCFGERFGGSGSLSINGTTTAYVDNAVNNNHVLDVVEGTAGASDTTFSITSGPDYSSIVAISLKEAVAPAGIQELVLGEQPYLDEYDEGFALSIQTEDAYTPDPVLDDDTFVTFEQPPNLNIDIPPDDPPAPPDITQWLESFYETEPYYDVGVFESAYDPELPADAIEARFEADTLYDPGYIEAPTEAPPVADLTEIFIPLESFYELEAYYDSGVFDNYQFVDPPPPEPEPEPEPEPPAVKPRKPMRVRVVHMQRPYGGFNTNFVVDDESN